MSAPRLAIATRLISAATMLSRVLGLVREQLFAALMGASFLADAFVIAFRIPNLLRDLFAEGALSQAFVPTFKSELKNHGEDSAYDLANRVAGTLLVVLGLLTLIGGVFAPVIVNAMAAKFAETPGKFDLTVRLTRIMLPFLPIVSLAAVAMGMLNARDRYSAPALAPAMFNVISICIGSAIYIGGVDGEWIVIGWSIGTVLAGAAQLGIQLPSLWKLGFRPRITTDLLLKNKAVRRVGRLMLPAIIGVAAVQVNIVVNTVFATRTEGAAAWLNYAFRFLHLPIGVFGVAIATVSTTRYSDAAADGDHASIAAQLQESLRLAVFLTLPATVGLMLIGEPIIRLIYERGEFGASDTAATVAALQFYTLGLVFYASIKVIAPAFYAVDHARIPMIASLVAVVGNLILNITLHPLYGYSVLALGTAAAAILNFGVLYVTFGRIVAPVRHGQLAIYLARVAVAGTIMGAAVYGTDLWLASIGYEGLAMRLARVGVPVVVAVIVYAGACAVLRIRELGEFTGRLRR